MQWCRVDTFMATSLVAKVLGKSGRFAKEEVSTVLENLSQKIDEVKVGGTPYKSHRIL